MYLASRTLLKLDSVAASCLILDVRNRFSVKIVRVSKRHMHRISQFIRGHLISNC